MTELAQEASRPHAGSLARALKIVTLSLVVAVFAAFAAHHAESIFAAAHSDAPSHQTALAIDDGSIVATVAQAPQAILVAGADILQIVGFGCVALLLCGLLGALVRATDLSRTQERSSGGQLARTVAVFAATVSRIPPSPSLDQLSISRT